MELWERIAEQRQSKDIKEFELKEEIDWLALILRDKQRDH